MDRTLTVMRHAKSAWGTGERDFDRPLAPRGRRDAAAAAAWMTGAGYDYHLVLCSGAARARQTWAELAAGGVRADGVQFLDEIYHGHADTLFDLISATHDDIERLLVIGHQPTVESFCVMATDSDPATGEGFPPGFGTSAFAVLTLPGTWGSLVPGAAHLVAARTPRG